MKSFFEIFVLSALVAMSTTQPTHNSPYHDVGPTQQHTRLAHHMSQPEHHMSQPDHQMSQQEHYGNQPELHMSQPEYQIRQPQHHIMSQPKHYMSQPQHGYKSWSTAEAQANAQSQITWNSPEQPPEQPVEIMSQPHHINQPRLIHAQPRIHSQPQPMDPQFELHPYPYQHPHYPPIESKHTQDTVPLQPTYGWNMQNPASVYQHPLPEAPEPQHNINSYKEDYPNQSSALANAVASSNSVPVSDHELAHPQLYKITSIPKADNGANYVMPVADHETRQPKIIHTSNDEGLPDIVQEILAKYRHTPIEIKPDNNVPSHKEHTPEGHGPIHRPHKHKKNKVPTIPLVTKQSAKAKAVAVAKTGTDNLYTIITGGKHRTATKVPLKHKHKHSHKKVLKPLLDPELLAKELGLLSKELWVPPSPEKTHEKDSPCDDNPIITDDHTNPDYADSYDGSNPPDKNKSKNKPEDKHHHRKHSHPHIIADKIPEKDMSEKTTTPSTYIELNDKKDADTEYGSANLDKTTEPSDDDDAAEKEDKKKKHEQKPLKNEEQNTNSNPADPNIENNDLKKKEIVQKNEVIKEVTKKVVKKKGEKIDQSQKYESEPKKYDRKPNLKEDQKNADDDKDWVSANTDETPKQCDDENAPDKENEGKKHVPKPKTDDKQNNDLNKNKPKNNPTPHHDNKYDHTHTPTDIVPVNDKEKTTTPSTNFKPGDQKDSDKDNNCDAANSDETTKPRNTDYAPEKENKTKKPKKENEGNKHVPRPKTDDKQNNDLNKNKPKNKLTPHHNNKNDHTHTPTDIVPVNDKVKTTTPSTNFKPGDQKGADKGNDCDSANFDETTKPRNTDYAPEKEDETKKHLPKTDDKRNVYSKIADNNSENIDTITDTKVVQKKEVKKEMTRKVKTDKEETVQQSKKTKQQPERYNEKQKPVEQDFSTPVSDECDSTEGSVTQVLYDKIPASDYNDKKEQSIPHTKKDQNKPQPVNMNQENKDTPDKNKPEHTQQHNKNSHPHFPTNTASEKEIAKSTTPSTYIKPYDKKIQDNADKDNDSISANPDKTPEPCDGDNIPEKENEGKEHVLKPNTDDKLNNDWNKNKPKNKPHTKHHDNKHAHTHTPTDRVPVNDKVKTTTQSTNFKLGDQKGADKDNDCDSANSDETTEPCDTDYAPEKENKIKKLLPKPDATKNINSQPVDNKGNTDTITEHKIVQKKDVQKEVIQRQLKETKQRPETYNETYKPVEQDYSTPVSDECDSTQGSVTEVPYDKIPAPEHKKEINKPLLTAKIEDYKPISPDTDKGNKDEIITAKKDVKKVEQSKEVTRKVETQKEAKIYQTLKNIPKPNRKSIPNHDDKIKPENLENIPSDIEDSDSTESNEPQTLNDETPAPEYKSELNEPLPKGNKDNKGNKGSKDLTKKKKIDSKKEEVVKVDTKIKKSTKNVTSPEAVDKSKSPEKSNENTDVDDYDSADSETDPKLGKTNTIKEKLDPKKKKTEEVNTKNVTLATKKAEGIATGEELTSDEVAEILEKIETNQPLSTVGFLISLISHALQGSDSVRQLFEEPKVKTFVNGIIPLFHDK